MPAPARTARPQPGPALPAAFFNRDAQQLARDLLGKVVRHRVDGLWLSARIIETEAYYLAEKGSHASLGYTHKRRALFMDGGVVYMYYARGGDSLNFSAAGPGNAVLIKSGHPWVDEVSGPRALACMQRLNPDAQGQPRPPARLCA
ncbi:DNA-3-methyladenine glycosylase, partial [Bordetella pertussis]